MLKNYYVYILTNKNNTVLYTGVTNNIYRRVSEHKKHRNEESFTAKYKTNRLVYYEKFSKIEYAIKREKQIKSGSRQKKIDLIESINPNWDDMYEKAKGVIVI